MSIRSLGFVLAAGLGLSAAAPALAMHHEKMEAAFKAADKDGDGTLDREEAKAMPRIAKHFDRSDADKSGTVTAEELQAFMKQHMKKHRRDRGDREDRDTDRDDDKDGR